MFKKLRKWYFKLYHLFRFLGILILIFGLSKNVYAEECEEIEITEYNYWKGGNSWRILPQPRLEIGEYIIYFEKANKTFREKLQEMEITLNNTEPILHVINNGSNACDLDKKYCTQVLNENITSGNVFTFNNIPFTNTGNNQKFNNNISDFHFVKGGEECLPKEEQEQNEVYTNFLTLYIDRINYLTKGFTENPYLLAMIGIILTWVVLELFLKILHLGGGYKK